MDHYFIKNGPLIAKRYLDMGEQFIFVDDNARPHGASQLDEVIEIQKYLQLLTA